MESGSDSGPLDGRAVVVTGETDLKEAPADAGTEAGSPHVPPSPGRPRARIVPKPDWLDRAEKTLGSAVPLHPHWLSAAKVVVVTPMVLLALRQVDVLPGGGMLVTLLLLTFGALDYLDGVVARARGVDSDFGRIFDRATDYPLLLVVSYFCIDLVSTTLLVVKLALDLLVLILYARGRGSTENRIRTGISYATLFALLLVSQGWAPRLATPQVVEALLEISIGFTALVALHNLRVFQKRFIADTISAANLVCGGFSMVFASRGRFEISLLFLLLGAALDGFDGAAARRWGGTRFGVYSDDIADGVNYGIAPGVALYFAIQGLDGIAIGAFFSIFTISRLVYFTLSKAESDPSYFSGVPSTVGGLVTLCSIIVFEGHPAVIGLMVGIACAQMVSFATHYRHLGRALSDREFRLFGPPLYLAILVIGSGLAWDIGPAAIILAATLGYGFLPTLLAFRGAVRGRA